MPNKWGDIVKKCVEVNNLSILKDLIQTENQTILKTQLETREHKYMTQ